MQRVAYVRPPKVYKHRRVVYLSDEQLAFLNALKMLTELRAKDGRESEAQVIRTGFDMLIEAIKPIAVGLRNSLQIEDPSEREKEVYRVYLNHLPLLNALPKPRD